MKPRTTAILVPLAVALGIVAEHLGHSWGQPAWIPIADLAVGWAMVGSGVAAATMRPAQPAGRRLALAGFLWFVGTFQPMDIPQLGTLAFIFQGYFGPVVVLIALSFPARWPARRSERIVISGSCTSPPRSPGSSPGGPSCSGLTCSTAQCSCSWSGARTSLVSARSSSPVG